MNISVIIPLKDEADSLPELTTWIRKVMETNAYTYEVILVDDGSTDQSWEVISSIHQNDDRFKGIKFKRNYGKSAALNVAFKAAKGDVVITMDADLQDSPDEIPSLYHKVMHENFDIVSGWKKKRFDNVLTKNIPSKFFNAVTRKMSGIQLNDFNCGLKAVLQKAGKGSLLFANRLADNKALLDHIKLPVECCFFLLNGGCFLLLLCETIISAS